MPNERSGMLFRYFSAFASTASISICSGTYCRVLRGSGSPLLKTGFAFTFRSIRAYIDMLLYSLRILVFNDRASICGFSALIALVRIDR